MAILTSKRFSCAECLYGHCVHKVYDALCEPFFCLMDELGIITFSRSMRIIIDALMDSVMEYFHITEQGLEAFTTNFIQKLPKYM